MAVDFFYDDQIRRFLLQFTRIFSGFQVEYGKDDSGNPTYQTVPVRYGDASRQAQTIIANNSANSMPCAPMMSFYVDGLQYARDRVQEPYFVDRKTVRQRTYDEASETYETTQGNAFQVQRHMPVPYDMSIKLDIWTTNTQQKWQLAEQILPMFNPSLEIQSTDNYLDWTSLSVVELTGVNYTSRSIPNNEEQIDIMTLTFVLPFWLSMPAKVSKNGIIHKVIAGIYDSDGDVNNAITNDDILLGTRVRVTPHGYKVLYIGNELQVMPHNVVGQDETDLSTLDFDLDEALLWEPIIEEYGTLRPGITQIRFEDEDGSLEIVGTVAYNPLDEKKLIFTVDEDTLPQNTLAPVTKVVNPLTAGPGVGLAAAASGQRYLLTESIGDDDNTDAADAWGSLVANKNDIIEYNGTEWIITYDSGNELDIDYVTNLNTSLQYKWTGTDWVRSYEGLYTGGLWSIVI
jgi:hypothetical protein